MIVLTVSEISKLHEKLISATGGAPGIRDIGLLESAVLGCGQTFGGKELYPTIVEKAAWTAYAICRNHPFVDGNKRVAVTSMLVTLRLNRVQLRYTQQELIELGLGAARGDVDYEGIAAWIETHIVRKRET